MKKFILATLVPLFALTACGTKINEGTAVKLEQLLENPLYAEQYYDELLDRMVELEIQKDPLLEDGSKQSLVDDTQRDALTKAKEATAKQREGLMGSFVAAKEAPMGEVLYVGDVLYLGQTFTTPPGPGLAIYLSTLVDPRDAEKFPAVRGPEGPSGPEWEDQSVELGRLESPYGAQRYSVPSVENPLMYRTVVLFDQKLERIYGFAQINRIVSR